MTVAVVSPREGGLLTVRPALGREGEPKLERPQEPIERVLGRIVARIDRAQDIHGHPHLRCKLP